jgi:uncharacterized membrane protein
VLSHLPRRIGTHFRRRGKHGYSPVVVSLVTIRLYPWRQKATQTVESLQSPGTSSRSADTQGCDTTCGDTCAAGTESPPDWRRSTRDDAQIRPRESPRPAASDVSVHTLTRRARAHGVCHG